MKKLLITLLPIAFLPSAWAADTLPPTDYSQVNIQLQQEQDLTLSQAKVIIKVSTTVKPKDLSTTLGNLSLLKDGVTGEWSLQSFTTEKTDSGLINLNAYIADTMPLGLVNNAYAFAKDKSNAGESFNVESVTPFLPLKALDKAKQSLSLNLYGSAQSYATDLSKTSKLNYVISNIRFYSNTTSPHIQPLAMNTFIRKKTDNQNAMAARVQEKLTLTAEITLAAKNK